METNRVLELLLAERVYEYAFSLLKNRTRRDGASTDEWAAKLTHERVLELVPEVLGRLEEVARVMSASTPAAPAAP